REAYVIKVLEAIFGHFIRLLLILLVPIMGGLGIYFLLPPSYQASATLWAIQPYQILDASGTSQVSAADTQVGALTELLQSRAFDVAVGKSTNLKSTFKLNAPGVANTRNVEDAYVLEISKNVQVAAKGDYSYAISYTSSDPRIASQVVGA